MGAVVSAFGAETSSAAGGLVRFTGPPRIAATLIESLSRLRIAGETSPILEVTVAPDARKAEGLVGGLPVWSITLPDGAAVSVLLGQITGTLATNLTRLLFVHAGAVSLADRGVIIVGHSGAGKTSTVAALIRKSAMYLSDEVALLDPAAGTVAPFALPMAVKPWTRNAAGSLPAGRCLARERGVEFWLPHHIGEAVPVETFVLLRAGQSGPRLTPISPAQMLLAISEHASSFKQQPRVREAFAGFARLLRRVRCVALETSRPAAHVDLLTTFARRPT